MAVRKSTSKRGGTRAGDGHVDEPLSTRINPVQGTQGVAVHHRKRTGEFYEPAIRVTEPVDEPGLLGRGCSDEEPEAQRTP
jgi:hypothetical protein